MVCAFSVCEEDDIQKVMNRSGGISLIQQTVVLGQWLIFRSKSGS